MPISPMPCRYGMLKNWQARTDELLARFRLTELQDRDGRLLSGGQMRRASLAIGVALNPGILLLDEPTANLDIATRKEIMRTLTDMKDITETVMIATHDMQLVCEWAQRIVVLCRGRVVAGRFAGRDLWKSGNPEHRRDPAAGDFFHGAGR